MQGWAQAERRHERTRASLEAAAAAAEEEAREVAAASVRALVTALDEAEMQVHEARRECDYWRHLHGEVHVNAQAQASQHATEREAAGAALEALRARVEQAGSEARAEALTMARVELDASHVAVRELQASVEALTARAAQAEAQAREAIERENVWHIVWGDRRGTSTADLMRSSASSAKSGGALKLKALVTALEGDVMADEAAAEEEANAGGAEQVDEDKGALGDDGQAREREGREREREGREREREGPLAALVAELASARIRAEEAVAEGERLRARLEAAELRTEQERMKGEGELGQLRDELRRAREEEVACHESRTSALGCPRMPRMPSDPRMASDGPRMSFECVRWPPHRRFSRRNRAPTRRPSPRWTRRCAQAERKRSRSTRRS
jgi:hypothetical protein